MVSIPSDVLRGIYDHMQESYPHECCGLLIGVRTSEGRAVSAFRRCRNLNIERANDRFEMDPRCWLEVEREYGVYSIVGIYHSHPDHPSYPSRTDTDAAVNAGMFGYSYLIGSVHGGVAVGAQSWTLNESENRFDEEVMVIL